MATITQQLLERSKGRLQLSSEGHWNEQFVAEDGYHSFNDAGIECEVGEFLYGLTRVVKPDKVLETGTHWGIGAMYLAMAMEDNQHGTVDTVEFDQANYDKALTNFKMVGLKHRINAHLIDADKYLAQLASDDQYGIILLDTEPQTRFGELVRVVGNLASGGFVFIHDLHRHMHQIPNEEHGFAWPFGKLPEMLKGLVRGGRLRPMHFATPRGLTGFYKPHPDDYNWNK